MWSNFAGIYMSFHASIMSNQLYWFNILYTLSRNCESYTLMISTAIIFPFSEGLLTFVDKRNASISDPHDITATSKKQLQYSCFGSDFLRENNI